MIRTPHEWATCSDPDELLRYLMKQDRITSRQARLFACACCRRMWPMITDERCQQAVEVAERYADGRASDSELLKAFEAGVAAMYSGFPTRVVPAAFSAATACAATEHEAADEFYSPHYYFSYAERPLQLALAGAKSAAERTRYALCDAEVGPPVYPEGRYSTEQSRALDAHCNAIKISQSQLLRDIVGDPFRPAVIDGAWLTWNDSIVRRLARRIYDECAWHLCPILADALEDASCVEATVLIHCRQSEGHVRGCWVIDSLLRAECEPKVNLIVTSHAERTWLQSRHPREMLEVLFNQPWSKRKGRLFMAACCRALEPFLAEERLRRAVEVAERYADRLASALDLQAMFEEVSPREELIWENLFRYNVTAMVTAALAPDSDGDIRSSSIWDLLQYAEDAVGVNACELDAAIDPEEAKEQCFAVQADLLRDMLGNPFHPVSINPHWLSSEIVELAQTIYEEGAFDRLPILANALEEAGCANADLLGHLRGRGPHVRGCWAVDLVLAKE